MWKGHISGILKERDGHFRLNLFISLRRRSATHHRGELTGEEGLAHVIHLLHESIF